MTNISFSQISKYLQCARSYKYYYVDRLREKSATAFLAFGKSMDEALNAILIDFKNNKSVSVDYKKAFDDQWQTVEINRENHELKFCTLVGYAKSDFIFELLTDEDKAELEESIKFRDKTMLGDLQTLHKELEERKANRAYIPFEDRHHQILVHMNWLSMRRKAHLMLDAYIKNIIPQIEEVLEVQKKIELESACGTKFVGFIDTVVQLKGQTGATILDNKTSASPYDQNKVTFSQQLSYYAYSLGLNHGAYAVMLKNIELNKEKTCKTCGHDGTGKRHKTCDNTLPVSGTTKSVRCEGEWLEVIKPEAVTQLVTGVIPQATQEMVIDNAAEVLTAIKANIFPRNLNTCQNVYGSPCPYLKKCWANKEDGLVTVKSSYEA